MTGSEFESDQTVLVEQRGSVLVITIDRPDQRNAINAAVAQRLAEAFDELDRLEGLRAGVLTGAGGNFCAGMDLKAHARGEVAHVPGRGFAGIAESPPRKPLIAAVEGWALGGGFEIVLCCDLVVAAETARFGLPEVRRGLLPRAGGCFRLARKLPQTLAMEALLTGEPITAANAAQFGLVNRVTAEGGALEAAIDLAQLVAENAPMAVSAAKQVLLESSGWAVGTEFARQAPLVAPVFESADAREGVAAFTERRLPSWTGR
jgi:enoyl-CoA hydratase